MADYIPLKIVDAINLSSSLFVDEAHEASELSRQMTPAISYISSYEYKVMISLSSALTWQ